MGKCILVIDDDSMNLKMAEHVLKKQSYDVILASSGAEGIKKAKENQIDLILLDILMPEMDGIETFRNLKLNGLEMPVIFLTASGDKKDVVDAMKLGAVNYVIKPFKPQDLLDRVANALQ